MYFRKHKKKSKKTICNIPKNKGIFGNMSAIEKYNVEHKAASSLTNIRFVKINTLRTY